MKTRPLVTTRQLEKLIEEINLKNNRPCGAFCNVTNSWNRGVIFLEKKDDGLVRVLQVSDSNGANRDYFGSGFVNKRILKSLLTKNQ